MDMISKGVSLMKKSNPTFVIDIILTRILQASKSQGKCHVHRSGIIHLILYSIFSYRTEYPIYNHRYYNQYEYCWWIIYFMMSFKLCLDHQNQAGLKGKLILQFKEIQFRWTNGNNVIQKNNFRFITRTN